MIKNIFIFNIERNINIEFIIEININIGFIGYVAKGKSTFLNYIISEYNFLSNSSVRQPKISKNANNPIFLA